MARKVKRENKIFILINLALLFVTQPGAIVWANFDAPYGFMKDLTSWLGSFIGLSPFALAYLVYKREYFGKKAIYAYAAFILILAYIIYAVQQPLYQGFRAPGYKPAFPAFLAVCFLGAVLSFSCGSCAGRRAEIYHLISKPLNSPVYSSSLASTLVTLA